MASAVCQFYQLMVLVELALAQLVYVAAATLDGPKNVMVVNSLCSNVNAITNYITCSNDNSDLLSWAGTIFQARGRLLLSL